MRLLYCCNYYPDGRELAHRVKDGDLEAIQQVARIMAPMVPNGVVLVPMPSHFGMATDMLDLAMAIGRITENSVENILRCCSRESMYYLKKQGVDISGRDLGMYKTQEPSATPCIIDNVYDTGVTMKNALKVFGEGIGLVFAKV